MGGVDRKQPNMHRALLLTVLAALFVALAVEASPKPPPKASASAYASGSKYASGGPKPKPPPKGPTKQQPRKSWMTASVGLKGITKSQFGTTEQNNFKAVIAAAMPKFSCPPATGAALLSSSCSAKDVSITLIMELNDKKRASNGVEVSFKVNIKKEKASTATSTLTTFLKSSNFKAKLNAKGGALASVTSTKVTSEPKACHPSKDGSNTCFDEAIKGLAGAIVAIIVICIILFCVCPIVCCIVCFCCMGAVGASAGMAHNQQAHQQQPQFQMAQGGAPQQSAYAANVPGAATKY